MDSSLDLIRFRVALRDGHDVLDDDSACLGFAFSSERGLFRPIALGPSFIAFLAKPVELRFLRLSAGASLLSAKQQRDHNGSHGSRGSDR
ncbi:hypothetical protein [Myceligenerans cantabricum]